MGVGCYQVLLLFSKNDHVTPKWQSYVRRIGFPLAAAMKALYLVIHVMCFAYVLHFWYLIALSLGCFLSNSSFFFSFIMETLSLAWV